jgi:soluble cytochrome b562
VEQHNIYIEKQLQESQTLEAVLKAKLEARATSVQDLRLMVSDSKEVERQLQTALTEKIDEIDQLKTELTIKKINRTSDNGIVPISYDANESMVNTLLDDFENMQNLSREAESGSPDRPANGRNKTVSGHLRMMAMRAGSTISGRWETQGRVDAGM